MLGVAGCSVDVGAYKFYFGMADEQTETLKCKCINTSDQNQNVSVINDGKGQTPSILNNKEKVLSSNEPSLDKSWNLRKWTM